jgi:hypothetical protein
LNKKLGELDRQFASMSHTVEMLQTEWKPARESDPTSRLDKQSQQLQALTSEVASLSEAVKKLDHEAKALPTRLDLAPAVKLYREKRYAEAFGAFRTLAQIAPDDARPWYYAALARGLATGQWHGEAEEFVTKGVERERAGTPSTAVIDAAFADLTAVDGRDWLAYYRQRASQ